MKEILLSLAKAAIAASLHQPYDVNLTQLLTEHPELKRKGAVFVTLTKGDEKRLRGCIGSLKAWRPLYEDVIGNAKAAAFQDTRFKPLSKEEWNDIRIEVSVLSDPKPLSYRDSDDLRRKIVPGKDGVILRYKGHKATYLPQVWEQLPTFERFFSNLCRKAKLPEDCLTLHPDIAVYRVTKYEEE